MLRLSGERATRARLVLFCLALTVPGCGNGDVRGEWTGTSEALGEVRLMLDLDGHFELTLKRAPTLNGAVSAAPAEAGASGDVTYSGPFEAVGDTIHLRGIPGDIHAVREDEELVLAAREHIVRLRRK